MSHAIGSGNNPKPYSSLNSSGEEMSDVERKFRKAKISEEIDYCVEGEKLKLKVQILVGCCFGQLECYPNSKNSRYRKFLQRVDQYIKIISDPERIQSYVDIQNRQLRKFEKKLNLMMSHVLGNPTIVTHLKKRKFQDFKNRPTINACGWNED